MKRWIVGIVAVLVLAGIGNALGAVQYSMTVLGTLPGVSDSYALGTNESGQVVGFAWDISSGYRHGFLYSNGKMTDLGTLGGSQSYAYGINDSGQVVGGADSPTSSGYEHAFLYSNGTMADLGTFGGVVSCANGINASGQVAGYATTSSGNEHAFLYSNGKMTDLGTLPGGSNSIANGINDNGQVVGSSDTSSSEHAFLYSNWTMADLGTLGGVVSIANGINASGQVVGYATTSSGEMHAFLYSNGTMADLGMLPVPGVTGQTGESIANGINASGQVVGFSSGFADGNGEHAFLYSNGTMTDLNDLIDPASNPGWIIADARAINDSGQIVGYAVNGMEEQAYLLTPVPEPTALTIWSLLGAFAIAMGWWRRRKAA